MYTLTNLESLIRTAYDNCQSQSVDMLSCINMMFVDEVFEIRVKFILKYKGKSRIVNYVIISDRICDAELKNSTILERIQELCEELKATD